MQRVKVLWPKVHKYLKFIETFSVCLHFDQFQINYDVDSHIHV